MSRTQMRIEERDASDASLSITYPMLLSGPLTFRAAGLANSVINRARQISEGGVGRAVILIDAFQPRLEDEISKLREVGRLGRSTELRNLWIDLRSEQRQPLPMVGEAPRFDEDSLSCRPDANDSSVFRYFRGKEYVAFKKQAEDGDSPQFVDLLSNGKRYSRLVYGTDGLVWQVQSFTEDNELQFDEYYDAAGYRFLSVDYVDSKPVRWRYLDRELNVRLFSSFHELLAYWLIHYNADILEGHVLVSEWAFKWPALVALRERLSCKIVCTFHNGHFGPNYRYSREGFKPELVSTLSRIPEMDALVVLTDEQRDDLLKGEPSLSNIHVIPHVVEPVLRDDVKRDLKKVVILSRLAPEKGIAECIEPFRTVVDAVEGVRLEIYGRGPEESRIASEIERLGLSDSVFLRGFTDYPIGEYLGSAVALFPSRYEGQPIALMEAVAAGCVPVAFDFKYGARYVIQDGHTGFITDMGNFDEMMDAVRLLLVDEERLRSMSDAGIRRLQSVNRAQRLRKDWEDLFLSLGCRNGSLSGRQVL